LFLPNSATPHTTHTFCISVMTAGTALVHNSFALTVCWELTLWWKFQTEELEVSRSRSVSHAIKADRKRNWNWKYVKLRTSCVWKYAVHSSALRTSITISPRFNGHFPGEPGLAGTRMYPFWILLELRVMEVVVTTAAIRCVKLQSNRHHQQTNTQFLQAGCPSCHPTNSVKALKGNTAWTVESTSCD